MANNELKNRLLTKVTNYFTPINFMLISPILLCEDTISMSTINYVVTNYAQEFSSYIRHDDETIYIHRSYKNKLLRYKKTLFDPFCRTTKFPFYYEENKYIITTVGQLNFYMWALEIGLIEFIRNNYNNIIFNMKKNGKTGSESMQNSISTGSTTFDSEISSSEKIKYSNKIIYSKPMTLDIF